MNTELLQNTPKNVAWLVVTSKVQLLKIKIQRLKKTMVKENNIENLNFDREYLWDKRLRWLMPILAISFAILIWEFLVRFYDVPHYLIPAPSKIGATLLTDGPSY